jgi:hypothetical protein
MREYVNPENKRFISPSHKEAYLEGVLEASLEMANILQELISLFPRPIGLQVVIGDTDEDVEEAREVTR